MGTTSSLRTLPGTPSATPEVEPSRSGSTTGSTHSLVPLLLDGVLYVSNVGNTVYALERSTGGLKWRYVHDKDVSRAVRLELYGAPQPVSHGEFILAGFHDGALVALTKDRGVREWQSTVGEGKYTDIIGRPAVVGEDVIVSGFSTPLVSEAGLPKCSLARRDGRFH